MSIANQRLIGSVTPGSVFKVIPKILLGSFSPEKLGSRENYDNRNLHRQRKTAYEDKGIGGRLIGGPSQAYDKEAYRQPTIEEKADSLVITESVAFDHDGDTINESDYSDKDYKQLLRKIDRHLLSLVWFYYGVQQTDKTSLGTRAIFGLHEDNNLHSQQCSWLTTILPFFIETLSFISFYLSINFHPNKPITTPNIANLEQDSRTKLCS